MKIDELISELEDVKEEHGNLEVANVESRSSGYKLIDTVKETEGLVVTPKDKTGRKNLIEIF